MSLAAIARAVQYSPGRHADNDRLILEKTVEVLRRRGLAVAWVGEDEVGSEPHDAKLRAAELVLSMCQGPRATALLRDLELAGTRIVNSPRAVSACYRANLFRLLGPAQDHFPATTVVATRRPPPAALVPGPVWVKRGDVQSVLPADVARVESRDALAKALAGFAARGIGQAIVQRHAPGMVVKFYGVIGSSFFRCYAEDDASLSPREVVVARARI
jgi:glutathione synthase/RimK-type ligase-like ATP-grasp enzyme